MKISVVIPSVIKNDSKIKYLMECVSSFVRIHAGSKYLKEIIIVDDGSDEHFKPKIQNIADTHGAVIVWRDSNGGFSKAVNSGIRYSTGDAVLLVNNDVAFQHEVLSVFADNFKDPDIGVVGGLLFYPNGNIQHGGCARIGNSFTHVGWHRRYEQAPEVHHKKYIIAVTGALFGITRNAIDKVGFFDESFFLASEDMQYCLRSWLAGLKVVYDPAIKASHVEGGTRGASDMEKLSQSLDTRKWFINEKKTQTIFLNWLKKIDLNEIDKMVAIAGSFSTQSRTVSTNNFSIIGIRRSGALGDTIMATPIVRELKRRHPGSKIIFCTHSPAAVHNNPNIDEIVDNIEQLRAKSTTIIDLDLAYENRPNLNIVDAYSEVCFGEQINDRRVELESNHNDFASAFNHFGGRINFERDKVVAIHQAVSWANRTWPKKNWDQVVSSLSSIGYKVVVLGSGSDFRPNMIAGVVDLVGKMSIPQIREIIKRSKFFIGTDSGLLHVAQTTDCPIIGLFTVADPMKRIVRENNVLSLIPKVACKFCLHEEKPPVTFVGCKIKTMQCLNDITPDMVISAAQKYR